MILDRLFKKSEPDLRVYDALLDQRDVVAPADIGPEELIKISQNCPPIATAINIISKYASEAPLKVVNGDNDVESSVAVDSLESPSRYRQQDTVLDASIKQYLIFGNVWVVVLGGVLFVVPHNAIGVDDSNTGKLRISDNDLTIVGKGSRFEWDTNLKAYTEVEGDMIMYHLANTSPSGGMFGESPLHSALHTAQSYMQAGYLNLQKIKQGGSPSGLLSISKDATPSQVEVITKSAREAFSKSAGKGGAMMILAGGVDYKKFETPAEAIDWETLGTTASKEIYNLLGIPLPMVSNDASTFNNMSEAKYELYRTAVLPLMAKMLRFFTTIAVAQGILKDSEEYAIEQSKIPAIFDRSADNAETLKKSGVLTMNEIRETLGLPALPGEQGDEIPSMPQPNNAQPNPLTKRKL